MRLGWEGIEGDNWEVKDGGREVGPEWWRPMDPDQLSQDNDAGPQEHLCVCGVVMHCCTQCGNSPTQTPPGAQSSVWLTF